MYTGGDGIEGQLGHGNMDSSSKPELVKTLAGKLITRYSILSVRCIHGEMALRVSWVMETWTLGLNQN